MNKTEPNEIAKPPPNNNPEDSKQPETPQKP